MAIQVGGCLYLLYLAVTIIIPRHNGAGDRVQAVHATERQMLTRGVITNISNPKALVFFLAFIPQFTPVTADNPALYAAWLGALLCIVGTTMNFGFGLLGTAASPLNRSILFGRTFG